MQYSVEKIDFETILADERARLVRLCDRFSGNPDAAEDLAQETLMAAWKSRGQLTSLDELKPWASAIARNVCLNWSRGDYRERAHVPYRTFVEYCRRDHGCNRCDRTFVLAEGCLRRVAHVTDNGFSR